MRTNRIFNLLLVSYQVTICIIYGYHYLPIMNKNIATLLCQLFITIWPLYNNEWGTLNEYMQGFFEKT